MYVYLAARYSRRLELCEYRRQLQERGVEVPARWLDGNHQLDDRGVPIGDSGEKIMESEDTAVPQYRRMFAEHDRDDVYAVDVLIAFTEQPDPDRSRKYPGPDDIETWSPVPGSTLGYEVSSFGRVRNGAGDFITGSKNRGYVMIKPFAAPGSKPNRTYGKRVAVHQLVAAAFIGRCPSGHEIDHGDGFKDNNWVGNLEYVTHLENIRRAEARGARGDRSGVNNGRAKLTYNDVAEIRALLRKGVSKAQLSRDYGVSDVNISNISSGKLWPVNNNSRGGRNVELGIALGRGKTVIVVGPYENIFTWLPEVRHYDTWDDCLAAYPWPTQNYLNWRDGTPR